MSKLEEFYEQVDEVEDFSEFLTLDQNEQIDNLQLVNIEKMEVEDHFSNDDEKKEVFRFTFETEDKTYIRDFSLRYGKYFARMIKKSKYDDFPIPCSVVHIVVDRDWLSNKRYAYEVIIQ